MGQAITLAVWPLLNPLFSRSLRPLRGIAVEKPGRAIARNLVSPGAGIEVLGTN